MDAVINIKKLPMKKLPTLPGIPVMRRSSISRRLLPAEYRKARDLCVFSASLWAEARFLHREQRGIRIGVGTRWVLSSELGKNAVSDREELAGDVIQ